MNPTQTTLVELRDAIASRRVSAVEAVTAYLDRVERFNGTINAYREMFHDAAIAKARRVDAGQVTGELAGVPLAVKDLLCTDYGYTTCSSRMLAGYRSPFTATAVSIFRRERILAA